MTTLELNSSARFGALGSAPLFATGPELGTTEQAREYVSETIEGIPTLFGRLEALANLQEAIERSPQLPPNLSFGPQEYRNAVHSAHKHALHQWLSRSFANRLTDLTIYLRRLGAPGKRDLTRMLDREGYRRLLPPQAEDCHREHFLADVRILLPLVLRAG